MLQDQKKVNQYLYRLRQAMRSSGDWYCQISIHSAHEGGKVVSHTHRSPLPARKHSWYPFLLGARGSAVGWGTALLAGRSRVRFPIESLWFFIDIILPTALWPWGGLRNDYQENLMGEKGGRGLGLTTLPPSCADCLVFWDPQILGTLRSSSDL
jgi:hypothetical protein